MEAFILADRVLTAEHMQPRGHSELKYLKRYDRSPSSPSTAEACRRPQRTFKIRHETLPHCRKTKNLLSVLIDKEEQRQEGEERQVNANERTKVNKYFTMPLEGKENGRKPLKKSVLIKSFSPRSQQYDANFSSVCPRMPCWRFTPHDRSTEPKRIPITESTTHIESKPLKRVQSINKKATESEEWVVEKASRKVYESMRVRNGHAEANNQRLQYSSQQLGRCTAEIFKKYQLDSDPYFKKFLSEQH